MSGPDPPSGTPRPDDGGHDLDRAHLAPLLHDRPLRTFPAMLSTEAESLAWARQGAPHGAVVVAGYQAAPRGRSGLSFADRFGPGRGLGCSLVLRLDVEEAREGWPYLPVLLGVRDALAAVGGPAGEPTAATRLLEWPDQVVDADGGTIAAIGVQSEPVAGRLRWTVATVLIPDVLPPRASLLAAVADHVDRRSTQAAAAVLADYRAACATLGRRVEAQMLPLGASSPSVVGRAADVVDDGGLTIATDDGRRVVVTPTSLGFLVAPGSGPTGPPGRG